MSAQTDWLAIEAASVYPQGAPQSRIACVEERGSYDAQVADPNSWRKDGSVQELAEHLAELCGYQKADRECMSVAGKILSEANGDSRGIADAFKRLETPRGNESDTFFLRTAGMNAPGWCIRQIVAEWKRGGSRKPKRGTIAADLAEMHSRGIVFESDIPLEDE